MRPYDGAMDSRDLRRAAYERWLGLRDRISRSDALSRYFYEFRNQSSFTDLIHHDRMLADEVRMGAYREGIAKHVSDGDVVVDLGTGTGVLAFLAARSGARVVHAVEHSGELVEAARSVAQANGITNVEFHQIHSRSVTVGEPVDVIVHEQIGRDVFDEQAVANVSDLRDRLLRPGGKILPGVLDMYVEPVQLREDSRAPYAWTQDVGGISFAALGALRDKQNDAYRHLYFSPFPFDAYLADPEPIVRVDLHTIQPGALPTRLQIRREAVRDGSLDGFCVYFRAYFDDELSFTNAPDGPTTSWSTPLLRVEPQRVQRGDVIELELDTSDLANPKTWRWPDTATVATPSAR